MSDFAPVLFATFVLVAGASLVGSAAFGTFKSYVWRVVLFAWGVMFTFIGGVTYVGYVFSLWEV